MPLPRFALVGRIVTMDDARTVHRDAALEIESGRITGLRPTDDDPPDGWGDAPRVRGARDDLSGPDRATQPPELRRPAAAPGTRERYADREQWCRVPDYRRLVSGPMSVLGRREHLLGPLARYVECKAMFGGTTTSQGIGLAANQGKVRRFYRGLIRNVEDSGDPTLPAAGSHIADVSVRDARAFLEQLQPPHRLLLHLAEASGRRRAAIFSTCASATSGGRSRRR